MNKEISQNISANGAIPTSKKDAAQQYAHFIYLQDQIVNLQFQIESEREKSRSEICELQEKLKEFGNREIEYQKKIESYRLASSELGVVLEDIKNILTESSISHGVTW